MTRTLPNKEAWIEQYPWINPYTKPYPNNTELRPFIIPTPGKSIAYACASHKAVAYCEAIHTRNMDKIDGLDWEILNVWHEGEIDGKFYYWGMPMLGLGLMETMVPKEWSRELTEEERSYWSNRKLSMVGSHTGKLSHTGLSSGVKA